jgi:hypothetical protein
MLGEADALRLAGRLDEALPVYRICVSQLALLGQPSADTARLGLVVTMLALGDDADARTLLAPIEGRFRRQRARGTMATFHLVQLCVDAFGCSFDEWDERLKQATQLLGATGYLDPDVAWVATLAGDLARERGEGQRALEVYQMALAQWEQLDRPAQVAAVESKMRAIQ